MAQEKRFLQAALLLLCLTGGLSARGYSGYSKKTFLAPRPQGVNTALEYATWHEHAYQSHGKTIHTNFQAAPFFQRSEHGVELGKYFGVGNGKNSFKIGSGNNVNAGTVDLRNNYLIHDSEALLMEVSTLAGTVSFAPRQENFGMNLIWIQDINHPIKGMFIKVSTPIVHTSTSMKVAYADKINVTPTGTTQAFSIEDFFKGNVSVTSGVDRQGPLTRAKLRGTQSDTGFADVDISLGHKYVNTDTKHVYFSADITIPTGNKPRGIYLFEPIYGNGKHFGIGCSLDTGIELWRSDKADLRLLWATRYKYLFEKSETRTPAVKNLTFSQYYLASHIGVNETPVPAANYLTQLYGVKPGSLIDTMVDFAFNSSKFTIDVGYNMFWKDKESVHVNNFANNTIGIIKYSKSTTAEVLAADMLRSLTTNDLDLDSITTPAQFTHKLFTGIGYTFTVYKKHLLSTGLGASYEFATSNADLENYAVWAKAGFSF